MRKLVELHEQVDEVNYFLEEWLRLADADTPFAKHAKKPELLFVSRAIEHVIDDADSLAVPIELKVGTKPILGRHDRRTRSQPKGRVNWLIPPRTTIRLTDYQRLPSRNGDRLSYVGNKHGLLSLRSLAETIAHGGELRLSGAHRGDWSC